MPKNMRHRVNVMRPTKSTNTIGNTQGAPETILRDWPCSIETMSGREIEIARSIYADATLKVEGYGNPNNQFKVTDYLTGGSIGERVLNIGHINDKQQNGIQLSLVCGEAV